MIFLYWLLKKMILRAVQANSIFGTFNSLEVRDDWNWSWLFWLFGSGVWELNNNKSFSFLISPAILYMHPANHYSDFPKCMRLIINIFFKPNIQTNNEVIWIKTSFIINTFKFNHTSYLRAHNSLFILCLNSE